MKKKRNMKVKAMLSLLLLVLVFNSFFSSTVQAAIGQNELVADGGGGSGPIESIQSGKSWVDDDELYGTDPEDPKKETFEEKDSGIITKIFLSPLNWIGDFLSFLLKQGGITMSNILFGRIDGGGVSLNGNRVNLYGFELKTGNIYGIVAASVYSTIRGVIYVAMIVFIFAKVVKASYTGNGSKALTELKEAVSSCILAFVMLGVMPYFVDLMLYMRDVILKAVAIDGAGRMFELDAGSSITDIFHDMRYDNLLNSLMYLASIGLTVYFAFTYVMVAMSFVVSFMAFPFVCINMQFDKHAMSTWWKNIFGYIMVPVVDSALLMIPAFIGKYGEDSLAMGFVQILVCFSIIPARAAFRTALGLSSNMGMELAGVGALMMAGRFATSVGRNTFGKISGAMGDRKQRKENENMATMEDELGELEAKRNEGQIENPDSGKKVGGYSSGMDPAEQKTFDEHATVDNFDSPAMSKNISHAKRAEMLRERNRQMYGKRGGKTAVRAIGGIAGGLYGAATGAGLGGMLSPSISMGLGTAGSVLGGKTGNGLVMTGEAIGAGVGKFNAYRKRKAGAEQLRNDVMAVYDAAEGTNGDETTELVVGQAGTVVDGGSNASSVIVDDGVGTEVGEADISCHRDFLSQEGNMSKVEQLKRHVVENYCSQEYGGKLDEMFHNIEKQDYDPGKDRYDTFTSQIAEELTTRYGKQLSQEYGRGSFISTGSMDRDAKAMNFSQEDFKKKVKEKFYSAEGIDALHHAGYDFSKEYAKWKNNQGTTS